MSLEFLHSSDNTKLSEIDLFSFRNSLPERVNSNEIQKAPELMEAIKMEIDRKREPGRHSLTGLCHILQFEKVSGSLAGLLKRTSLRCHYGNSGIPSQNLKLTRV